MFSAQFGSSFGDADARTIEVDWDAAVVRACVGLLSDGSQPLPIVLMQGIDEIEESVYELFAFYEFIGKQNAHTHTPMADRPFLTCRVDAPEFAWEKLENLLGGLFCAHAEREEDRGASDEVAKWARVFERIGREGGMRLLLVHSLYYLAKAGGGGEEQEVEEEGMLTYKSFSKSFL